MVRLKKRYFFSVFILVLLIGMLGWAVIQLRSGAEQYTLSVHVVHLYDREPVKNAVVEIVSLDGKVITRKPVDNQGKTSFILNPDKYLVRIAAGYSGQANVDLRADQVIELQVLPFLG